ncbi:MAG: lipoyl(octanoyl) transferase LipB [Pseudomonadales bacterium]|nr:lipoyl(octanoyl) transferase LipB [Pseudomonadales bacterium]MDG1441720.1 lipoyl(octanoyl) transferase LipB [Pseudomonadales bacterium]
MVRSYGSLPYAQVWEQMKTFTDERSAETEDELWLVEHPPVFTLGQAGKPEHILNPGDIAIVQSDRGGQVTYHGPGQLVGYLLIDLRRRRLGVRDLVSGIENALIDFLASQGIVAQARKEAPGVYVGAAKIAALGLRIRKGRSYHGFSLNVDMDLEPFTRINPCGYEGLEVTQLRLQGVEMDVHGASVQLVDHLKHRFGYDSHQNLTD